MKKIILLIAIILSIQLASALTIFSDTFESGTLSGWTLTSAAGANNWTNSLTDPFEGTRHAQSQPQSTSEPASVLERAISTTGYTSIILNYTKKLISIDVADEFQVEWFDGTTWIILEQTGANGVDDNSYLSRQFSLPATAENNANFKIKFECTAGAVSEFCRVDNVLLIGTTDTTPPTITINSPTNNEFINTSRVTFNITLNENGTALYTLNTGITNITMGSLDNQNFNATNTTIADSQYTVQFYTNDSAGNRNDSVTRTFTIDTTYPIINITSPQNASYNSIQTQLNHTVSDTNLQACWYSTNQGSANTTITCGQNITSLTSLQGSNTWMIYTNDSAGNKNSSSLVFFVDSIIPLISYSIGTLSNNTFISQNSIYVNLSVTETNEANITFTLYNTTNSVNITTFTTMQRTINWTGLTDGKYYYNVTIIDALNNKNTTETRTITLDKIAPTLTLVNPANTTYNNKTLLINITTNGENVWFYNGTANESYIVAVYRTFQEGSTIVIAYANDSVGNINSSSTTFFIDSISPSLSITAPQEGATYGTNQSLELNFSVSDTNLQACWYHVDSLNNITIPNCANTTFNTTAGAHTFYLYSNDTLNNKKMQNVNFTVSIGAPSITLYRPLNNAYMNSGALKFNYTATDVDLNSCELWGNFTGTFSKNQTNSTLLTGKESIFNLNLSDGTYKWNIRCNDTLGNEATTGNKTFSIDTLLPSISLTEPTGTKTSRQNIPLTFTVSDINLNTCWYNVYRGVNLEILNTSISCASSTFNVTIDATFTLNFYANDSAANTDLSSISFIVDTTPANSGGDGGSSSGSGGSAGGGIPKINVAPSILSPNETRSLKLSFDISKENFIKRGTAKTIEIGLINNERAFLNNCELEVQGSSSSWFISNQTKGLSAGEKFRFTLYITIPENAEPGEYTPNILAKCDEGEQNNTLQLTLFRNSFETKIINYERTVDALRVFYFIEEFEQEDHQIILEYKLLNLEGKTILKGEEKFTLSPKYANEKTLEFKLLKGVSGEYDLKLTLDDGKTANELTKRVLLQSKSILGLAISDSNRRSLLVFGIILVTTLIIFFIGKFIYKAYNKIKIKKLRKIEERQGKKIIRLNLKHK